MPLISEHTKQMAVIELTVPSEDRVEVSGELKRSKYENIAEAGRKNGWKVRIWAVQVGCRGFRGFPAASMARLLKDLGVPRKRKKRRLRQLGEAAERVSNSIWKWSHFKEWGSGRCEPMSSGGKSYWGSQGGQYYQYPPKLCDLPWLVAHDGDRGLQEWTKMLLDHHRKTRLVQVYVPSMLKTALEQEIWKTTASNHWKEK
ncbi:hypothetical protein EGW08_011030 [Elysia chlorotica]|uniref:Uncharacterized protein n=1 Tax=Elysia chlorotica TaxID=188477 RepID=A0A433THY5_ELYCH|nr:hypothetical protein EGW08_011030 [Elysia chlorotica]